MVCCLLFGVWRLVFVVWRLWFVVWRLVFGVEFSTRFKIDQVKMQPTFKPLNQRSDLNS